MSTDPHAVSRVSIRSLRSAFIVNPVSGRRAARRRRREVVAEFVARHGLQARVLESTRPGHVGELARAAVAEGAELVVSVGGDGTMNGVAAELVGRSVLFGLVPCGSGNGLARDLGLPLHIARALDLLLDARVRVIDTGSVNGIPFFNVAGFGLDAEIARRFNASPERGFASYFRLGFGALFSTPLERLEIVDGDGRAEVVPSFLTALANSTQYGNNAHVAPRARLDDGALDVVVVRSRNPALAFWLGLRAFAGTLDRAASVRSLRAARFTIRRPAPACIHTDGEVHACGAELDVRAVPASLRVLVPPREPGA